jgi:hypothetical protein
MNSQNSTAVHTSPENVRSSSPPKAALTVSPSVTLPTKSLQIRQLKLQLRRILHRNQVMNHHRRASSAPFADRPLGKQLLPKTPPKSLLFTPRHCQFGCPFHLTFSDCCHITQSP